MFYARSDGLTLDALAWLAIVALDYLHPLAYVTGSAILLRTTFTVRGLSTAAKHTRRTLAEGRLDKPEHYSLGGGLREPVAEDIDTAIRVAELTAILGVAAALGLLAVRHAIAG